MLKMLQKWLKNSKNHALGVLYVVCRSINFEANCEN